jgi:RNA polymerase sigma-70 factor (ECF subfamily)
MVFSIGLRILKTREDAEDVVQDVFAHKAPLLLEQNPSASREELGRLLAATARNLCIDRYRRRKRFPESPIDEGFEPAAPADDDGGAPAELAPLLASLTPRYREVLTLKYLLEFTWDEVASRLGLSQAGARKRADQARKALAERHAASEPREGGRG